MLSTGSRCPTRWLRIVAAMLALAAASSCSRSVTPAVEDAQLLVRVKTATVNDRALGAQDIEVQVSAGTIHLTGDPNRTGGATGAEPWPSLLAIGAGVGLSQPGDPLGRGLSGGPSIALRPGSGFGTPIAFSWYRGDLATDDGKDSFGRLRIRPLMAGVAYTFLRDRLSLSPSLVAGLAFNSLSINTSLESDLRAVAVDTSLVARLGVGVGYRLNRRVSVTGFVGRLFTRPDVTFVDPGGVFTRTINADTTHVTLGFAYWLF